MKFGAVKKIKREDLKEAPPWISALIDPLNGFMETVYQTLNKNVTFQDNIASFVREITYTTTADYPRPQDDSEFINELKTKAVGLIVIQAYEKNTYLPVLKTVYAPWIENNGKIVVSTIQGLAASTSYTIRFLVF